MVWDPKSRHGAEPQCEAQSERESSQSIIAGRLRSHGDHYEFYVWLTRVVSSHPPAPDVERKLWEFLISSPF